MRRRRYIKRLVLVGLSAVLTLALLEVAIRGVGALVFPRMMRLDDRLGWRHKRNMQRVFTNEDGERHLVKQNGAGLRGPWGDGPAERGKRRILVLGDSFTEAVHVADGQTFTTRLEQLFPGIEVLNAGVGGYGTVQEYLYLLEEGLGYRPDLVLVMFYDNDLSDNCLSYSPGFGPRPYARLDDGHVRIVETLEYDDFLKFTIPVPFRIFLHRHSDLYYLLNSYVYHRLFAGRVRAMAQADMARTKSCGKDEIFHGLIQKIATTLKPQGIGLVLVLIPARESVLGHASTAHEAILAFCRRAGIDCLSLIPASLRATASSVRLYFSEDIHWTKDGHRVAAEEIARHLTASGVLTRSRATEKSAP